MELYDLYPLTLTVSPDLVPSDILVVSVGLRAALRAKTLKMTRLVCGQKRAIFLARPLQIHQGDGRNGKIFVTNFTKLTNLKNYKS